MGCFKGDKYQTEAVSPEQEQMYKMLASIMKGGMGTYQSKPMYSTPANPMMTSAADFIKRQMGYGGYQQPGFNVGASQNVQMPGMGQTQNVTPRSLKAPWLA